MTTKFFDLYFVKHTAKMSSKLDDKYEILYTIGTGSYGTCKKVRRKSDGRVLVCKEMDYGSMSGNEKEMLVSEVNLLRELKHKHIVRYYDRVIDRGNTTIFIIMEYCEGGDLGTVISKCRKERKYLEEDFVWKIFHQTTVALQECHRRGKGRVILHRDLKPANVFLDKNHNVKLGDFGLARVLKHDTSFAKTFVGTPYYMSPEQMNKSEYNEKSDIWSLGCLIYELCALCPPFTASNQSELTVKIKEGSFKRIPSQYSSELSCAINSMLKVNPLLRPSIEEVLSLKNFSSKPDKLASSAEAKLKQRQASLDDREAALKAKEASLRKREELLELRERAVALSERHTAARVEGVKQKEQFLERREKAFEARERKITEENIQRADVEAPLKKYIGLKPYNRVLELKTEKVYTEDVHPDQVSQKLQRKKVHFAPSGKENQCNNILRDDATTKTETTVKTAELKERLYQAKLRGAALKQVESTAKHRSKQLLSMR